jgi:AcrR family transcriptional regulator
MSISRRTQAERREGTRRALLAAARRLFAERGYEEVGTEEIVRAAGVTRGALYHHFEGKAALLEGVYEQIEGEVTERAAHAVFDSGAASPTAAMKVGLQAFLDACQEPEVQRIALRDAPAVLGWERWREIAAEHGLGLIEASLAAAVEADELRPLPIRATAHVLMGALDEAALLIARSDDQQAARTEATAVLLAVLEGFAAGAG